MKYDPDYSLFNCQACGARVDSASQLQESLGLYVCDVCARRRNGPENAKLPQFTVRKSPRTICLEFEELLKGTRPEELHKVLLEYISETNHQGWDFSKPHMTGIKMFFEDFMLYYRTRIDS